MDHDHRTPSARSFTRWAVTLVLPLVLAAAAMPWVLERLKAVRRAIPPSASRAEADGGAGAASDVEPARRPEAPSTSEIESARAAETDAARLQQRHLAGSTVFTPRQARVTADGERVAPFQGFGLSVESTPAGARVRVRGDEVGETPLVTSVDCTPGQEVEVGLELRGHRPVRRTVTCRADALLELSFSLAR